MNETAQFRLPLLAAAQAQKHVTVNEALVRLDVLARLRVVSASVAVPPPAPEEGEAWIVPDGASGAWAGRRGEVAIWINGGWCFAAPRPGWTATDESTALTLVHDGSDWIPEAAVASVSGAATVLRIHEFDHAVPGGAVSVTEEFIPAQSSVIGVTARVLSGLGGTATSWSLGVAGSANRYGSGLGLAAGSHALGLTGTPVTYYEDTPLRLTAEGGSFGGGLVRIAVHLWTLRPPRPA